MNVAAGPKAFHSSDEALRSSAVKKEAPAASTGEWRKYLPAHVDGHAHATNARHALFVAAIYGHRCAPRDAERSQRRAAGNENDRERWRSRRGPVGKNERYVSGHRREGRIAIHRHGPMMRDRVERRGCRKRERT